MREGKTKIEKNIYNENEKKFLSWMSEEIKLSIKSHLKRHTLTEIVINRIGELKLIFQSFLNHNEEFIFSSIITFFLLIVHMWDNFHVQFFIWYEWCDTLKITISPTKKTTRTRSRYMSRSKVWTYHYHHHQHQQTTTLQYQKPCP